MALLGDLARQGELHPLIVDVKQLPSAPGALRSFAITDQMRWGSLKFKIVYRADVLAESASELHMVARQPPRVSVDNRTVVADQGDGTIHIRVTITLTAPSLLFGYAFRQAEAAHRRLGEQIRLVLEA
ncbi:SRPBCC family protein [Micromonospora sonneratiae]|uniref:SRPBCC family protein n=1 Tax=Micromonospora sonneratiae TaxID=1184706 RepID=A0ABW3YG83_9ACTN